MDYDYSYNDVGGIGQFQELKVASCFRGEEYGISSIAFDPQEDLLWAATYGGHVTSFYSSSLEKYTAFQAHHEDIRQLQPTVGGVVTITEEELKLSSRNGLPSLLIKNEESLSKMNCALYLDDSSLLVGCQTGRITTVDLSQGQVVRETLTNSGVCLLKPSEHYICCGDVTGQVFMTDPLSLQTVAAFPAHMAGMCDMDVVGNLLVTCGLAQQYGQLCVEPQLKIFDLRYLRPVAPCDVTMLQPFLLRCMPAVDSTILVLSQMGEFQLLDLRGLVTPSSMVVSHINAGSEGVMACAMDVGPSCQCLAFGDSSGVVHLWADQEEAVMNPYAVQNIAFPDQADKSLPFISWDSDDTTSAPLSSVPMALTSQGRTPMFSHWPVHCSKFVRRMAPTIDSEVLDNMRWSHFVGYAPKPPHVRHNQVPYDLERDLRDLVPESPMMRENNPLSLIPKPFRQVEIKYSKLGIETFDFGHYNETKFAGLEIHIPNAYCNCMLQVLYFMEPIRCAFLRHLCSKEFCLACELGLLFRMLDKSEGQSCQASNFLRAFRTLREAAALGLLLNWENEERKTNLGKLVQNWTRFVLQQLKQETDTQGEATPTTPSFKSFTPNTPTTPMVQVGMGSFLSLEASTPKMAEGEKERGVSIIQQLFGSSVETLVRCRCGWSTITQRVELLFSLCYPHNSVPPHMSGEGKMLVQEKVPFSSVLQQSICRQQRVNSWCEKCGKYKSTTHQKSLCHLPSVLTLNCQVDSEQDKEFWQVQQQMVGGASPASPIPTRWVPLTIKLSISAGNMLTVREDLATDGEGRAKKEMQGGGGAEGGEMQGGGGAEGGAKKEMQEEGGSEEGFKEMQEEGGAEGGAKKEMQEEGGAEGGAKKEMQEEGGAEGGAKKEMQEEGGAEGGAKKEEGGAKKDEAEGTSNLDRNDTPDGADLLSNSGASLSIAAEPGANSEDQDCMELRAREGKADQTRRPTGEETEGEGVLDPDVDLCPGTGDSISLQDGTEMLLQSGVKHDEGLTEDGNESVSTRGEANQDHSMQTASDTVEITTEVNVCNPASLQTDSSMDPETDTMDATEEEGTKCSPIRLTEDEPEMEGDDSKENVQLSKVLGKLHLLAEEPATTDDPSNISGKLEGVEGTEGEREGEGEGEGEESAVYELSMVVSHVKEPWMEMQGNLVAHIRVGPTYHHMKEGVEKTQWYLFNDFHITPIKESEVGVFPMEWLTPAVLIYTKKDYTKPFSTDVSCQLDPIVLLTETHSPRPVQSPATFTPLAFGELPSAGDLVGIDAEFVTLNQEEAEVKSDGTHTTLKPSQFSVARITIIRGKGAMEGSSFIDDYIATSEQVVDYLTKFSGIKPGDLDASMSSKHLTTLKASYLKILYLLESGVKFVGHGLNKDFRVINILVPPEHIIDTVKLFHLPNQRYISLKFLAWFFLNMHIQKEAHDSCEDACTALLLYRKYQELEGKGRVGEMLQSLYDTGRSCNWKVPET